MWKRHRKFTAVTELWAAPEQLSRKPTTCESLEELKSWDHYSFGLLVWFVATQGRDPCASTLRCLKTESDETFGKTLQHSLSQYLPREQSTQDPLNFAEIISGLCVRIPRHRDIFRAMNLLGDSSSVKSPSNHPGNFIYEVTGDFQTSFFWLVCKDVITRPPERWELLYHGKVSSVCDGTSLLTVGSDKLPRRVFHVIRI
jgi:hypothetical protein